MNMLETPVPAWMRPHHGAFFDRAAPLLAQGIPVFPCRKDKRPLTGHGFKDATTDAGQISAWAEQWPDALIGVPTGKESGLFVLDVDVKNGKDGFATLQAKGWTLPETRTHRTKTGGGAHYLFRNPDGRPLKNSAGSLGDGMDTRGEGGYIIWWPAHDGEVEHSGMLADVPAWLLAEQTTEQKRQQDLGGAPAPIQEGSRNAALTSLAGALRRAGLGIEALEAALLTENARRCDPPLSDREVKRIASSVSRYETSTDIAGETAEVVGMFSQVSGPEYPEPMPLPDGLPVVAPCDLAMLPDTLRPWAADICERVQCAPDYVAVAIMAGLGSIIGRKVGIRPQAQTDWTVTPNQWALVVGRPGVLKSPALEAALSPIKRLAAMATETHKAEAKGHAIAVKLAKLKAEEGEKAARKALSSNPLADVSAHLAEAEPEPPALRRYIAVDSNAASLGELHRQNPNGLLVHRDEMVSLLKSLDREDQAEARGFYLTGWNGDSSYTFDRIGRGLNLHIPAVCLSMLGSTQPGRIAEYIRHAVKGGAGDDGLIQRFGLLVWPDTGGDWRNVDRWPDDDAKRAAFKVFENLGTLNPDAIGAQRDTSVDGEPEGLPYLRFDAGGLGLFLEWRTDLEARLRADELHPAMESHLAKYRKLVPGLALVLHLADGGTGPVSQRATLQALAWAEYLETHARRAYASVTMPEVGAAKAILARIRKRDLPLTFSSRDVWRPGWAQLSDRAQVADALATLVELDWLVASKSETGGRPGTVYAVNPRGLA